MGLLRKKEREGAKDLDPYGVKKLAEKGDLRGLGKAMRDSDPNVRRVVASDLANASLAVLHPELAQITPNRAVAGIQRALGLDRGRVDPDRLHDARQLFTEPLVAMLEELEERAGGSPRQHAAEAARAFCDERAVEPLIALLQDSRINPGQAIRHIAAEALGAIGDARAVVPLAGEVVNPANADSMLPGEAAKALERLGDAGVEGLIYCLRASKGGVGAKHAVASLHRVALEVGTEKAIEALPAFLTDPTLQAHAMAFEEARSVVSRMSSPPLWAELGAPWDRTGASEMVDRLLQVIGRAGSGLAEDNAAWIASWDVKRILASASEQVGDEQLASVSRLEDKALSEDPHTGASLRIDHSVERQFAMRELQRREETRDPSRAREAAIQRITSGKEEIRTAVAERAFRPPAGAVGFEVDSSGHPKSGALPKFLAATIDAAVSYIHANFGLVSDPLVEEAAKRQALALSEGRAKELSKELRSGWHRDVETVTSISGAIADSAIDAYLSVLRGSGM